MRHLYPAISPYHTEYVCCDNHQIYVEHLGNPEGIPVLYLHGGPGGGMPTAKQMQQLSQQMGKSGNPLGNINSGKMPGGLNPFGGGGGLPGLGGFPGRKK